ncbi:MAG: GGDEF domain-containing protein [Sulfuricurvum sp. PD_MW2]|jgi:diguanylate cyclase|uniref:GGDEF domain-containing protein n=1 Tax=Sulfuricurvum sp. PD_MW2 TaxID=2027917 RepID=UPI000C05F1BE|nr:diguanylate cyclase [Sulfuricurvum sp. PD_MW2]PHM18342.1 MAG: GGDEF domain-containing protein [Sulfuricurvum sp. PD_MW2]
MDNSRNYQKVVEIHDHAMGILRSMKIPPYPSQYKKFFDQLFAESADEALRKDQENVDQKILGDSKDDVGKYLDMVENSVVSFIESHSGIASVAEIQRQHIQNAPSDSTEKFVNFIEELNALHQNMVLELEKAQVKIDELNHDLQEARATLTTDLLTKVGNRQGFMEDIEPAIEAGASKPLSMVLIMIDVDNFKFLNDEFGYVAGDKVLFFIAQTIKSMIRTADKVYRYGGEEFAIVLNRCDVSQAQSVAEKIRAKIEQSKLLYAGKNVHVTVSAGVTVHKQGDTLDSLIERADKALYCAKKSNKNCTMLFDW